MKRALLLSSTLLLLAACAGKPIYNVDSVPIVTGSGTEPSLAKVQHAITEASLSKDWVVKQIDSTNLQVTHRTRKLMAQALIAYSTKSFSITYNDSEKLKHKGGTIHNRYNMWIRGLEVRIKTRLAAL